MKWIFVSYTVPANPSRARVFIWRELRKLGAINYQTVWVLPYSKDISDKIQNLKKVIENCGGQALLVEGKVSNKQEEEKVIII